MLYFVDSIKYMRNRFNLQKIIQKYFLIVEHTRQRYIYLFEKTILTDKLV